MGFRVAIDSIITDSSLSNHFVDSTYYEPDTEQEESYARLFMNIEVRDNPSIARTLRRIIFDTFTSEMYRDMSMEQEKMFETVLKKVNTSLYDLIETHGDDWISKLHVALCILTDDMLHVSVCGQAQVLYVQKNNAIDITEGLVEGLDYEHIFQNIASGHVQSGDTLIATNKVLPEVIAQALPSWNNEKDIQSLFARLESELKHYSFNLLGFNLMPGFQEAIIHSQEEDDMPVSIPSLPTKMPEFGSALTRIAKSLKHIFIPPEVETSHQPIDIRQEEKSYATYLDQKEYDMHDQETLFEDNGVQDVRRYEEDSDLSDLKGALHSQPYKRPMSKGAKWSNTLELFKRNFSEMTRKFQGSRGKYSRQSNMSQVKVKYFQGNRLMAIIIAVILLFVVVSVVNKYKQNQVVEELRGKLVFVDEQIKDAKTRNALDEKDKAREVVEVIYGALAEIKETKYLANEVISKEKEVLELEDKINEVIRVDAPDEFSDLSSKFDEVAAHSIFRLEDALYAVSEKAVFQLLLSEVVLEPITGLVEGELAIRAVPFEEDRSFLILTSNNRILKYKDSAFAEVNILDAGLSWPPIESLETYGRRMYVITDDGAIWRYSSQSDGFTAPISYVPEGEFDVAAAKDLSIDGDIYYLMDDGEIIRTRSLAVQDFNFTEFPDEFDFSQAEYIYKSPVLRQLFIFDPENKRVVVTGFRGFYSKQFVVDNMSGMQDIYVDEDNRKLYILTDQKVFVVGL